MKSHLRTAEHATSISTTLDAKVAEANISDALRETIKVYSIFHGSTRLMVFVLHEVRRETVKSTPHRTFANRMQHL